MTPSQAAQEIIRAYVLWLAEKKRAEAAKQLKPKKKASRS
jgi:hypothetical protein